MSPRSSPRNIVVIGGGIAGVSTAYFLSTHPRRSPSTTITIVEGTKIAAAASGFSGGFLAKDWHGSSTASLSEFSYDLHASLAEEFGGKEKWGYRTVETLVSDCKYWGLSFVDYRQPSTLFNWSSVKRRRSDLVLDTVFMVFISK